MIARRIERFDYCAPTRGRIAAFCHPADDARSLDVNQFLAIGHESLIVCRERSLVDRQITTLLVSKRDLSKPAAMGIITLNARVVLGAILLLSTNVSSSFVPRPVLTRAKMDSVTSDVSFIRLRGGSEEPNMNQGQPPIPSPVPSQAQTPESVPQSIPDSVPEIIPESIPAEIPSPVKAEAVSLLGPNASPPGYLRKTFPSLPWHRLPNMLTYMRCLAIPALMILFYQPNCHVATGILFAFASFTDWLDGFLARRWDISSAFGAFLDPVADKLMVSTSLILLTGRYGPKVAIPTAIILAREIGVSALREWMAQRGQRDVVKVGMQGKVKTALTMVALTVLLFVPTSGTGFLSKLLTPGLAMLYLCSVVTITSGSVYFLAAAPLLLEKS